MHLPATIARQNRYSNVRFRRRVFKETDAFIFALTSSPSFREVISEEPTFFPRPDRLNAKRSLSLPTAYESEATMQGTIKRIVRERGFGFVAAKMVTRYSFIVPA